MLFKIWIKLQRLTHDNARKLFILYLLLDAIQFVDLPPILGLLFTFIQLVIDFLFQLFPP